MLTPSWNKAAGTASAGEAAQIRAIANTQRREARRGDRLTVVPGITDPTPGLRQFYDVIFYIMFDAKTTDFMVNFAPYERSEMT